jgi:hypothetical protein
MTTFALVARAALENGFGRVRTSEELQSECQQIQKHKIYEANTTGSLRSP